MGEGSYIRSQNVQYCHRVVDESTTNKVNLIEYGELRSAGNWIDSQTWMSVTTERLARLHMHLEQ